MTVTTRPESAASLCVRAALTPWLLDLTPPATPPRESLVYFIQSGVNGPIKIGKAINPESRLAELQVGSPFALRLIGATPGDVSAEHALHVRFREDHIRGEWFHPSATLLAYIAEVAS